MFIFSIEKVHWFVMCRLVRLMSPKLNVLVIIGGLIMYFSVVLYTLPVYDSLGRALLCNVSLWLCIA